MRGERVQEGLFNTRFDGTIQSIREKSVAIQLLNDGECCLVVPRARVPKLVLHEGAAVFVWLTTRYGRFGVSARATDPPAQARQP